MNFLVMNNIDSDSIKNQTIPEASENGEPCCRESMAWFIQLVGDPTSKDRQTAVSLWAVCSWVCAYMCVFKNSRTCICIDAHKPRSQGRVSGVLSHCLPYSFEARSLSEPGACSLGGSLTACLHSPKCWGHRHVWNHSWLVWSPVFITVKRILLTSEPSLKFRSFYIILCIQLL